MDNFTLALASAIAATVMAASLSLMYWYGARQRCLIEWALAGMLFAVSNIGGILASHFDVVNFSLIGLVNACYVTGHGAILAGLRRHLGLAPRWDLLLVCASVVWGLHQLPLIQAGVANRIVALTPLIALINLSVAWTIERRVAASQRKPYLPLLLLELVFMLQLSARAVYLLASDGYVMTFAGSQFLQTSGSLFVLLFVFVATMSCVLIVTSEQARALRTMSRTDALTGWLNRRALQEVAAPAFETCRRSGASLMFITFDIDHFKTINDCFGHGVGDEAIRHVTAIAGEVLRGNDQLFRIGGEEFAVLLTGCQHDHACAIAERLRERIAGAPLACRDQIVALTVSVGLAHMASSDHGWEDVLKRSDDALYQAKTGGRNRLAVHGKGSTAVGLDGHAGGGAGVTGDSLVGQCG